MTGAARHGAGAVGHLVELVDAADALVAQHQRAALQHHLPRLRVLLTRAQTTSDMFAGEGDRTRV